MITIKDSFWNTGQHPRTVSLAFLREFDSYLQLRDLDPNDQPPQQLVDAILEFESEQMEHTDNMPIHLGINYYRELVKEYEFFIQDRFLDNIYIVLKGFNNIAFSTVKNDKELKSLMDHAIERSKKIFVNQQADLYPSVEYKELNIVWFPPNLIDISQNSDEDLTSIKNNINDLLTSADFLIDKISVTPNSDGWERGFYDNYFVPKQFYGMLGRQLSIGNLK